MGPSSRRPAREHGRRWPSGPTARSTTPTSWAAPWLHLADGHLTKQPVATFNNPIAFNDAGRLFVAQAFQGAMRRGSGPGEAACDDPVRIGCRRLPYQLNGFSTLFCTDALRPRGPLSARSCASTSPPRPSPSWRATWAATPRRSSSMLVVLYASLGGTVRPVRHRDRAVTTSPPSLSVSTRLPPTIGAACSSPTRTTVTLTRRSSPLTGSHRPAPHRGMIVLVSRGAAAGHRRSPGRGGGPAGGSPRTTGARAESARPSTLTSVRSAPCPA